MQGTTNVSFLFTTILSVIVCVIQHLYGDWWLCSDQFFFLPLHLLSIDEIYTKQFSFLLMFLVLIFVVNFFKLVFFCWAKLGMQIWVQIKSYDTTRNINRYYGMGIFFSVICSQEKTTIQHDMEIHNDFFSRFGGYCCVE